jgi:hypothetical protein
MKIMHDYYIYENILKLRSYYTITKTTHGIFIKSKTRLFDYFCLNNT